MLVSEAVSEVVQQREGITSEIAYVYMKKVHRWLCDNFILKTELFNMALTSGVISYTLDTSIKRVRTVTYIPSENSFIALLPESTKDWDVTYRSWRNQQPSQPVAFSVEEGQISYRNTPNTTSVGVGVNMYPRVDVWAATSPPFAKTDSLPPDVFEDVYITGTIMMWCQYKCPEQAPIYAKMFADQIKTLEYTLVKVSHNFRPRQTPAEMYQRSV